MMKIVALLVVGLVLVSAFSETEYQNEFTAWMHQHQRTYSGSEFLARYRIFKSNMDYIRDWNANNEETVLGLNHLADLTNEEYRNNYLGLKFDASNLLASASNSIKVGLRDDMNSTVDWRTKGVVTPVKNQGQCQGCWSFSATGATEGVHAIKTGNLVSLSEQNLIDCSTSYGNGGCNGGLMTQAFQYIIANKGIDTEASYPFEGENGACRYNAANSGATLSSFQNVASGSEADLQSAVDNSPVSVGIDASHTSFQLYKSGVYYNALCSSTKLDHGVLAIGYGTDETTGKDYWLVKNSWSTTWGMQGYIAMARNRNNNCGIATMATYPIA